MGKGEVETPHLRTIIQGRGNTIILRLIPTPTYDTAYTHWSTVPQSQILQLRSINVRHCLSKNWERDCRKLDSYLRCHSILLLIVPKYHSCWGWTGLQFYFNICSYLHLDTSKTSTCASALLKSSLAMITLQASFFIIELEAPKTVLAVFLHPNMRNLVSCMITDS